MSTIRKVITLVQEFKNLVLINELPRGRAPKYQMEFIVSDLEGRGLLQIKAFDHLADDDDIMCIPPVNGERPAAEFLMEYIREVWGNDWIRRCEMKVRDSESGAVN